MERRRLGLEQPPQQVTQQQQNFNQQPQQNFQQLQQSYQQQAIQNQQPQQQNLKSATFSCSHPSLGLNQSQQPQAEAAALKKLGDLENESVMHSQIKNLFLLLLKKTYKL